MGFFWGVDKFLRDTVSFTTYGNINPEKPGMATLISGNIEFTIRRFTENKEPYFIVMKGSIHQEDITNINTIANNCKMLLPSSSEMFTHIDQNWAKKTYQQIVKH